MNKVKPCGCVNCTINRILIDKTLDRDEVEKVLELLGGTIDKLAGHDPITSTEDFRNARFMTGIIMGYLFALDAFAAPAFLTQELEITKNIVSKALDCITVLAVATGQAQTVTGKVH